MAAVVCALPWKLGAAAPPSRIVNLSILTTLAQPGETLSVGYVVGGEGASGAKPLLIRAAGPSLRPLGVPSAAADPRLEIYAGSVRSGGNDNWGGVSAVAAASAGVGAFPFSGAESLDAAMLASAAAGGGSARITASSAGSVLAEIYDLTPAAEFTATTPRLVNVSVLKDVGAGLTVGFVISGSESKTILVRAVGPSLTLAPFEIGGVAANPKLTLFGAQRQVIAENEDWGGRATLAAAFAATGAFELPASSADAAILVTLPPGEYSAVVGGGGGLALVEVYEVSNYIEPPATAQDFTLAVLPDTQYYSKPHPAQNGALAMFTAQTDWIQRNHATEGIVYVAHLGDITDDGDSGGSIPAATQWANAVNAMRRLETPVSIPYGLAVGNHDQEPNGDVTGTTNRYNENFGIARFQGRPYYGGHYGTNNNNHYDYFSAAGVDYLAVYVEYDAANARPALTAWANEVIAAHPSRRAILVTHYMANAGNNYAAFGAQGARLYTATRANNNLFLALGGHVGGIYNFRRDPSGSYGRERLTTLVSDYQFEPFGGAGYMRLYRMSPAHGRLRCRSYSPYLDQYRTDYGNDFTQSLDPRGPAEEGAVVLSDDRLAVVAVLSRLNGRDLPGYSTVAVNFQAAAKTNRWSAWIPLPGQDGFRQVHAVALSDNRLVVFAAGQASDGWVRQQLAPGEAGAWAEWQPIAGTPRQPDGSKALSTIKGVRLTGDRLAAVGWTDGGAVYVARQAAANGPFSAWTSLGGADFRQGDVVRLSDDRLAVFAVGHDTAVQVNVEGADGSWGGWSAIPAGGGLYSYVSAIARPDNSLAVFATRVSSPTQLVRTATSGPNGTNWSTLANVGTGGSGFARVHAVLRADGRIGLFASAEHGVAQHCAETVSGTFGPWRPIGAEQRFEIGSVKGVVLSDNSFAAVSHGASTTEHYAFQPAADGAWTSTGGLPMAWTR